MADGHRDNGHGEGLQNGGEDLSDGGGVCQIRNIKAFLTVHQRQFAERLHFLLGQEEAGGVLLRKQVVRAAEAVSRGGGDSADFCG